MYRSSQQIYLQFPETSQLVSLVSLLRDRRMTPQKMGPKGATSPRVLRRLTVIHLFASQ